MNLKLKSISTAALLTTLAPSAYAAGFAIQEQSITGLGRAFAGSAAVADDASTIFFNPAGMTYLDRAEMDLGLNYISPRSEFHDEGSNIAGALPMSGGNYGDASENALVPNFYYAQPINDKVTLGLGIGAPFGLVTEYNETWVGRYFAVKSDMLTINLNPSMAIQATDKLSLGFGISAQYIDVELSQMADLGALTVAGPESGDGKVDLQADDWGYGFNLGLIYQATDNTRFGVAYRSKISHTLEGDGELSQGGDTLVDDNNIEADVDLPETLSVAIYHDLNSKWAITADATWTRWSRFSELNIKGDALAQRKAENWENTMRYGLGLNYNHSDKWQFRTGVAYDETPIPNKSFRTARIPGNDRLWVAVGASYHYSDNIVIDASYAHLFMNDPDIDETDGLHNLKGRYEASVDLLGVQLRWLM